MSDVKLLPATCGLSPTFAGQPRRNRVYVADALDLLRALPDGSVNCIVTSPPYFGLRAYLPDDHPDKHLEIGLEETPAQFIAALVEIFHEAKRVLRDDGNMWVNMGDSYVGGGGYSPSAPSNQYSRAGQRGAETYGVGMGIRATPELPAKNLLGMPWRLAFALQDDGWILRSDIIWHKCLSGGASVYAKTQKGEMPMTVKDMVRLDPATVQLWDGEKWNQAVSWTETSPDPERKSKSQQARSARYRGVELPVTGDIEIELRSGERIGCTRNHRWPTQRGIVSADDIKIGDVLCSTTLPEPVTPRNPTALDDNDIGWFVGLYIAEGSQSDGTIQIASHIKETERFATLQRIATAYDGYAFSCQTSENGMTIAINSPILRGVLESYIAGTDAKTKHLHARCWKRSNQFLQSVLMSYLNADGHKVDGNRYRLGFTKNDALAQDLRTLSARLGYSFRLRRCKHVMGDRSFDGWRGDIVFDVSRRRTSDTEVIAIRQSRARHFYDIVLAENPHLFALSSGVLTHNSNPMPESVTDRPTKSHEYVFLFAKQAKYWYDADAIREPQSSNSHGGTLQKHINGNGRKVETLQNTQSSTLGGVADDYNPLGRNARTVWTIATEPNSFAHFATFPQALITPMILAGCPDKTCVKCGAPWVRVTEDTPEYAAVKESMLGKTHTTDNSLMYGKGQENGKEKARVTKSVVTLGFEPTCSCGAATRPGIVYDPFMGSGTTGLVARKLGRDWLGSELNSDYVAIARERLRASLDEQHYITRESAPLEDLPMFAKAVSE